MPKDKGSKLANFLGLAIRRLKGGRPDLNPKGQTKRSTEGPARQRKKRVSDTLKTQRQLAKRQQPEPVVSHRIDVYRNLVGILLEFKGLNLEKRRERVDKLSDRGMARANAADPRVGERPSDEELNQEAEHVRQEEEREERERARQKARRSK